MGGIWDRVPQPDPHERFVRRGLQVRRPAIGEKLELICLERAIGWYATHYFPEVKRTFPCLGEDCGCAETEHAWEVRFEGWIVAAEYRSRKLVLASVTPNAWKTCEKLRDRNLNLRGCKLTLERREGDKNAPVFAAVVEDYAAEKTLPTLGLNHRDYLLFVYFNGKDDYEVIQKYADLYGKWAPVQGAESQQPKEEKK